MISPDWDDVGTVYDRMQGLGLLRIRARPGGIAGHVFSLAVFARADRYASQDFDMDEFIEEYCDTKEIDKDELMDEIRDFRDDMGHWDTDPISLLEVLSAL